MRTLVDGFREMVHLIGDTFRLWWRNLLPMATWCLAGFVGFTVCIAGRDLAGQHQHSSLGTGLFSVGVLMQITAAVGMIRTCAMSLYRWRDAASEQGRGDLGPDAAWPAGVAGGHAAAAGRGLVGVGILRRAGQPAERDLLVQNGSQPGSSFFKLGNHNWHGYLPALVVLLVLRRVFQAIDDRWPSRPVKFAQVWAEAFFVLLTVRDHAVRDQPTARSGSRTAASGTGRWTGGTASRASSRRSTSRSRPVSSSSGASSGSRSGRCSSWASPSR